VSEQFKDKIESSIKICDSVISLDGEKEIDSFRFALHEAQTKGFDKLLGDNCSVTIMEKIYTQDNNVFNDRFDAYNMPTEENISYIYWEC